MAMSDPECGQFIHTNAGGEDPTCYCTFDGLDCNFVMSSNKNDVYESDKPTTTTTTTTTTTSTTTTTTTSEVDPFAMLAQTIEGGTTSTAPPQAPQQQQRQGFSPPQIKKAVDSEDPFANLF
jgi:hypothetical protein